MTSISQISLVLLQLVISSLVYVCNKETFSGGNGGGLIGGSGASVSCCGKFQMC